GRGLVRGGRALRLGGGRARRHPARRRRGRGGRRGRRRLAGGGGCCRWLRRGGGGPAPGPQGAPGGAAPGRGGREGGGRGRTGGVAGGEGMIEAMPGRWCRSAVARSTVGSGSPGCMVGGPSAPRVELAAEVLPLDLRPPSVRMVEDDPLGEVAGSEPA